MIVPGFNHRFPKEGDDDYLWSFADCHARPDDACHARPDDACHARPDDACHARLDRASPPYGRPVILSEAKDLLIETCCTTLDYALAAQTRGADRIELCTDLSAGGFTPPRDLIRDVVKALTIPVNVLIRPSAQCAKGETGYPSENIGAHASGGGAHLWEGGFQRDTLRASTQAIMGFSAADFVYDEVALQQMIADIDYCKSVGAAGIVVGALTPEGAIDLPAMRRLIAAARPLPVTFHRAFDVCAEDPMVALDKIIALGCTRLLTSGRAETAWDGRDLIAQLVRRASGRIIVMPGSGITPENLAAVGKTTCANEFHGTRLP